MTLNTKVLSLVLLTGLTMGGAFAKKQKPSSADWNNDSHSVKWSEEKCDAAEVSPTKHCPSCPKPCETDVKNAACCPDVCCEELCGPECGVDCAKLLPCCSKCTQVLRFQGSFSFEQVVRNDACPRPITENPGKLCGKIELAFDPAFTKLCWRITICGADNVRFDNARPTAAFLHIGDCNEPLTTATKVGRNLLSSVVAPFCVGPNQSPICHSGSITAFDLACSTTTTSSSCFPECQSIACLYQATVTNNLFVAVLGSFCVADQPDFTVNSGGVLRAMLLPCLPACAK